MNNMKQMAVAMSSYTADYNGYYPSWPAYGGPENTTNSSHLHRGSVDQGRFTDINGDTVLTGGKNNLDAMAMHTDYRTLFNGVREDSPTTTTGRTGKINTAPIGLGYLAYAGYMNDLRGFFCQSAGDGVPADTLMNRSAAAGDLYGEAGSNVVASLRDLARSGGYDARSAMYGNWAGKSLSRVYVDEADPRWYYLVIQGAYNYRNVSSFLKYIGGTDWTSYHSVGTPIRLRHIRPNHVMKELGGPIFKTEKQLAQRALVSDTFSRGTHWRGTVRTVTTPYPGKGRYAHREGYNVLYGDGRASWYGDPQQKIMWWAAADRNTRFFDNLMSLQKNCVWGFDILPTSGAPLTRGDGYVSSGPYQLGAMGIWHEFDNADGMDVGVDW